MATAQGNTIPIQKSKIYLTITLKHRTLSIYKSSNLHNILSSYWKWQIMHSTPVPRSVVFQLGTYLGGFDFFPFERNSKVHSYSKTGEGTGDEFGTVYSINRMRGIWAFFYAVVQAVEPYSTSGQMFWCQVNLENCSLSLYLTPKSQASLILVVRMKKLHLCQEANSAGLKPSSREPCWLVCSVESHQSFSEFHPSGATFIL